MDTRSSSQANVTCAKRKRTEKGIHQQQHLSSARKHVKQNNGSRNDVSNSKDVLYEVESVQDVKLVQGRYYFLIKWKGYGDRDNSWEPEHHLEPDLLHDLGFRKDLSSKAAASSRRQKTRSSLSALTTSQNGNNALPVANAITNGQLVVSRSRSSRRRRRGLQEGKETVSSAPAVTCTAASPVPAPVSTATTTTTRRARKQGQKQQPLPLLHAAPVVRTSPTNEKAISKSSTTGPEEQVTTMLLTDSLVPGKVVEIKILPDHRKIALIKWCNHPALTWISYDVASIRYPDIVLDYYEALLVFDS